MNRIRTTALCALYALTLGACQPNPAGPVPQAPAVVSEIDLAANARSIPLGTYVVGNLEPPGDQPAEGTDLASAGIDRYTVTVPAATTVTLTMQDDEGEAHTVALLDSNGQLLAQAAQGSIGMPQTLKKGDYVLEARFMGSGSTAKGYYIVPTVGDDGTDLYVFTENRPVTPADVAAKMAKMTACAIESRAMKSSYAECMKRPD